MRQGKLHSNAQNGSFMRKAESVTHKSTPCATTGGLIPCPAQTGWCFLAVVRTLGELPESEMKETRVFDKLPDELTYPQTSPKLFAEAEKMMKEIEVNR